MEKYAEYDVEPVSDRSDVRKVGITMLFCNSLLSVAACSVVTCDCQCQARHTALVTLTIQC